MRVVLYGIIAEKAGREVIDLQADSLHALHRMLLDRIPGMDSMSYAIAVDRVIITKDVPLLGDEEIAVLPPFAGG